MFFCSLKRVNLSHSTRCVYRTDTIGEQHHPKYADPHSINCSDKISN